MPSNLRPSALVAAVPGDMLPDTVPGDINSEQSALKCLYLATRALDPDREGQSTLGDEVEAGTERFRRRLRGPEHPE
ncbi:hypothetical protein GCM10023094_12860 [Rhodococcus olei]|uniref:Uncharacterized protein n=1 Tax=Rhodococcus olei TaxID=2161675 RepID=A0ABP8NZ03_9NOCA